MVCGHFTYCTATVRLVSRIRVFFFEGCGDHRDLHVQTHSFPTRRSSDLLFPVTQITFGPATEDGFYYDFAPAPDHGPFTEDDLPAIEEEMRRIIARDEPLIREVWTRAQLIERWTKQGETFKAEWSAELPDDEALTVYKAGKGADA